MTKQCECCEFCPGMILRIGRTGQVAYLCLFCIRLANWPKKIMTVLLGNSKS